MVCWSYTFWRANGQQADSKWFTDIRTENIYKSVHATVCALKHPSTVWCSFTVRCMAFFHVITACILLKCYSLDSYPLCFDIYRSTVCPQTESNPSTKIFVNMFVHKPTAISHPKYLSTVCRIVFQRTKSAQEHGFTNRSVNRLCTNRQKTLLKSTLWHLQFFAEY